MNVLSFNEWKSLLPKIPSVLRTPDQELQRWYADELDGLDRDEELFGYKRYEALTYSGENIFYINTVCDGENCKDFFIVAVDPDYKIAAYDWYTLAEMEATFKPLGKSVFEAMSSRNKIITA